MLPMRIGDTWYRTIWRSDDGVAVEIIDQTLLPHVFHICRLRTVEDAAEAISAMRVRGAPLIGATAAYGMALAAEREPSDGGLEAALGLLAGTRPTAVNLRWALSEVQAALGAVPEAERAQTAWQTAARICEDDVAVCRSIGEHGLSVFKEVVADNHDGPLNVLTHCNAGWLATVDWGTALAPIYMAHDAGIPIHVWVDETRPRNQGAALTAYELGAHGVPHTLITDNAGGHLMQHGRVDLCIVGTDRTTASGDVANKIGTYTVAVLAKEHGIPFYVAAPVSTFDLATPTGEGIPIEERSAEEVTHIAGHRVTPDGVPVRHPAFDITPHRLVTAIICERGVARAPYDESLRALAEQA